MKIAALVAALTLAALGSAPQAGAQMVVSRDVGEHVDRPVAPLFAPRSAYRTGPRRHHRYLRLREPRILALRRSLPTPQPFGWAVCCL